ncbi:MULTISPECIES: hypothetical protein [Mesorhizobium]|uniref:Lipoprotein n=1 Tax=Mesorhizobium abyssinicae TaxID=1209958 RepID=A0ABU5AUV6_9HYPH|nr:MULTISPECIES: hypothetical protein [Mesorhizobium]MDX8541058.1 hypothetical protein [Mesorhizobium abyssinicae]RUW63056.1 hypothetical protein EOA31_36515 [Mesorhizobium sp. M4B.F.Ca.ET.049.02.1.2]RVD13299.1 hypothetical protein EN738_34275 [Mesorhizobium sp. M4B.F.Ca.ET.017.02.2.1]RWX65709.1 hypothetical protein EN780_17300 [Mesorhizobium sp. M4B.F.Ca.ET.089.01.1.1]TGV23904.1 hypothetical protein EN786_21780 [Mesorhizobium sp. M4B.F.Ca.ET.143.01.1.1]
MGKGLIVMLLAAALAGCTTSTGGFCAVSRPLRLSAKAVDALSDEEARALLAHNRKGQKLCGWRP